MTRYLCGIWLWLLKPKTDRSWSIQYVYIIYNICVCSVAQPRPIPWTPKDGSPPGSSVHGFLQAGILEWVAIPSSRGPSQSRDQTQVSCIANLQLLHCRYILYHCAIWEAYKIHVCVKNDCEEKAFNESFPKKIHKWPVSTQKDAWHH